MGLFGSKNNDSQVLSVRTSEELEREVEEFDFAKHPASATTTSSELYALIQAGYQPINVAFGNVVYSMGIKGVVRSILRALKRGEMSDFTRFNRETRLLARNRMLEHAKEMGADLVVDVRFEIQEIADFMEITAVGTAVKKTTRPSGEVPIVVGV